MTGPPRRAQAPGDLRGLEDYLRELEDHLCAYPPGPRLQQMRIPRGELTLQIGEGKPKHEEKAEPVLELVKVFVRCPVGNQAGEDVRAHAGREETGGRREG